MSRYGVWCVKSGGVTGYGAAWLKRKGERAEFDTREAAEAEARRLNKEMNGPYSTATFRYEAAEL